MAVVLILAAWVLVALALALVWVGYRRYVGTHSLEDFDVPLERRHRSTVHR